MELNKALSFERTTTEQFIWEPTSEWYQGRGVYGGLIFAVISKALNEYTQFPIRRLHADNCAPLLAEKTSITIVEKRRGINTQFLSIECLQNGRPVVIATATCGGQRANDLDWHKANKQTKLPSSPAIPHHPSMPTFTKFFDYWPILGSLPFSKPDSLVTGGWIRCKEQTELNQPVLCALSDAWWPAVYLSASTPRPMGTISYTIDFTHPQLPQSHQSPCLLENKCEEVRDGYSVEFNRLWSADGTLLAMCQQLIAIIK